MGAELTVPHGSWLWVTGPQSVSCGSRDLLLPCLHFLFFVHSVGLQGFLLACMTGDGGRVRGGGIEVQSFLLKLQVQDGERVLDLALQQLLQELHLDVDNLADKALQLLEGTGRAGERGWEVSPDLVLNSAPTAGMRMCPLSTHLTLPMGRGCLDLWLLVDFSQLGVGGLRVGRSSSSPDRLWAGHGHRPWVVTLPVPQPLPRTKALFLDSNSHSLPFLFWPRVMARLFECVICSGPIGQCRISYRPYFLVNAGSIWIPHPQPSSFSPLKVLVAASWEGTGEMASEIGRVIHPASHRKNGNSATVHPLS